MNFIVDYVVNVTLAVGYFSVGNRLVALYSVIAIIINILNILLDVNEDLTVEGTKNITQVTLPDSDLNITDEEVLDAFPDINEKLLKDSSGVELIINVTKDINAKTERDNKVYEKTFKPKPIILTYLIIFQSQCVF